MKSCESNLRVGVIHGPGNRITPVWFDLKHRKHTVREITNSWRDRQGEAVRIHFHVTDDGALYELVYDLGDGCWALERVEARDHVNDRSGDFTLMSALLLEQKGKGSHVISPAWRPQGVRNIAVR